MDNYVTILILTEGDLVYALQRISGLRYLLFG